MVLKHWKVQFACISLGLLVFAQVHAQATRTWISGVGDDANPCSRTAPCKTFPGAIAKTASGGVIDTLDPGGFGTVTITKSITLEASNGASSILASGVNGVIVNGTDVVVTLRGLSLEGAGSGLAGVKFLNGSKLIVDHCDIGNFRTGGEAYGIDFSPSSAATLIVRDSNIHGNGVAFDSGNPEDVAMQSAGIRVAPGNGASATVVLDGVLVTQGTDNGVQVFGPSNVTVRDSTIADNVNHGIWAIGLDSGGTQPREVRMMLDNVAVHGSMNGLTAVGHASVGINGGTISSNAQNGIWASGETGNDAVNLHLHGTFISNNAVNGVLVQGANHAVNTYLDNVVIGDNPQSGIFAQGGHAKVVLTDSTVSGSVQGIRANNGAAVISYGGNRLYGNTVDGAPTDTRTTQ